MRGLTPIRRTEDRAVGAPMLLIAPHDTASDNTLRLLDRLQEDYGYDVEKEYANEHQAVYAVAPGGER